MLTVAVHGLGFAKRRGLDKPHLQEILIVRDCHSFVVSCKRVWMGVYKYQLSVKILAICQLSVKFKAICQLSVNWPLIINLVTSFLWKI